jgi:hypothetical protein
MEYFAVEVAAYFCAVHMVLASFESVGISGLRDDSIADPPVPGSGRVAAATTGAAVITTRNKILKARAKDKSFERDETKEETQKRARK